MNTLDSFICFDPSTSFFIKKKKKICNYNPNVCIIIFQPPEIQCTKEARTASNNNNNPIILPTSSHILQPHHLSPAKSIFSSPHKSFPQPHTHTHTHARISA